MKKLLSWVMNQLSKLGRAMFVPLAATPIAGLLAHISASDMLNLPMIENASWVVFSMMDLLFAIGSVMAYAKVKDKAIPIIGAIGNFNHDAVVEVPCYVGASGVEPVAVGYIPQFHKSLMEAQKGYEKLAVEACLEGSYDKALQAILLNKTVPSYRKGKEVLDDFLELNKDYWNPKFYK